MNSRMKNLVIKIFSMTVLFSTNVFAGDAVLKIQGTDQTINFARKALLARKDVITLETSEDPSYPNRKMSYRAVPASALFEKIKVPVNATIQFQCLDGFSAPIPKDQLLSTSADGSIAYIAIEVSGKKWPALKPGVNEKSAGPFYLVWKDPKKSKIGPEEWPFQLSGFVVKESIEARFPNIVPNLKVASVGKGFKVFLKNCFACHTMNGEGESKMGPDLNIPMSPIEYLGEANVKKQIRNPQDLRAWPQAKMNGFAEEAISNEELGDLLAYLKQMSTQKVLKK